MKVPCTEDSLRTIFLQDSSQLTAKSIEVADDICNGKNDITTLVERLGFALTSPTVELRAKATVFLSETLTHLPAGHLNGTQINFIATFYCDRLRDHHSVLPGTLTGILAIARMQCVPAGICTRLMQAMFQHVACQSQLREDREKCFSILQEFSRRHVQELTAMSSDFVYGVINAIDGERDPRILVRIFDFVPTFLKTYALHHLAEEMFEVCACYFPVDFHPAPNDPEAITRDMLAEKLAACLCGSPLFADSCLTLLLEKMDSQLSVAKLDSLHLLSKCAENFKTEDIDSHFGDIWQSLRTELLPGGANTDITVAALDALETIIQSTAHDSAVCDQFLLRIFEVIMPPLADVDARLFQPATAIGLACARSSKYAATTVSNRLLPLFVGQYKSTATTNVTRSTQRCTLLDIIRQFLFVSKTRGILAELDVAMMDTIQMEFVQCLAADEDVAAAADNFFAISLTALIHIVNILTPENRDKIYAIIDRYISSKDSDKNVQRFIEIKRLLHAFANEYPDEVMEKCVGHLLVPDDGGGAANASSITNRLEAICSLVTIGAFTECALSYTFRQIFDNTSAQLVALQNLRRICESAAELNVSLYGDHKLIDRLIRHVNAHPIDLSEDVLLQVAEILSLIVRSLTCAQQTEVIAKYLPPMDLQRTEHLYLTAGLLGFLDENVPLDDHFETIVKELSELALRTDSDAIAGICHRLLCSIFNKIPDTEQNNAVLKKTIDWLREHVRLENKRAIKIISWIAKGLLVRGHSMAAELVDSLLELLEHPTLANSAAMAFEILSIEFPALHLPLIKHLYKQKLFQWVLKKLWNKLNEYTQEHLIAFTFVLRLTPHTVIKMNIEKIGPVLFKCLSGQEPASIKSALDIIEAFLKEQDEYFRDHLQHLIPSCLKLAKFKESLNIRMIALNCLITMTKYPTIVLLPYRSDVLQELLIPLDDTKRLVRNVAVQARNQWCLVGV